MVRHIIDALDDRFDRVIENDEKHACLKAAAIGSAEGFMNVLLVSGALVFIGGVLTAFQKKPE